jgi:hypothetical protein
LSSNKTWGGSLTPFSGKNYFTWKKKLNVVLRGLRLYEYAVGDFHDDEKDRMLSDLLIMTLSDNILNNLMQCADQGRLMLNGLEDEYNRKDVGSKYAVLTQLLSYLYKGKRMEKHCDDVILLMNELSGKGMSLDPELCVCILLCSLPAELPIFASTVSGQLSDGLTIDVLRTKVIAEEARKRGNETRHCPTNDPTL